MIWIKFISVGTLASNSDPSEVILKQWTIEQDWQVKIKK